ALFVHQRGGPELSVDLRAAGAQPFRLDVPQDRARVRVDLVDLARAVFADAERTLGPRQARVAALSRRGNAAQHAGRLGVHRLDPVFGDLPEIFAIESGPGVGRDVELAQQLSACRVDGGELFAPGEPDVSAVPGDAVDFLDARKRAIFADDLRALRCLGVGRGLHGSVRDNAPAAPPGAT